eukprot:CAMPEP_0178700764 /NCGR_PEP_ID=MMETSP0699-20121125/11868_1 /TAXON_ID=265572 /ORGANISM="Extubocellulus spinifer, Strain CCMP396" /LENGTH=150 /DNA_ID=CAMNT_0020347161 /DNA_START=193 /DNA_END=645 /DNA_ORIENTATION=-
MMVTRTTRIGAIYNPPALVVEYMYSYDGGAYAPPTKRAHRLFHLQNLSQNLSQSSVAKMLMDKFPAYFSSNVPFDQVCRMVGKIFSSSISSAPVLKDVGDLNSVPPDVLNSAKQQMDVVFNAAVVKPGDEGYEYDKKVDFEEPADDCSWD